MGYQFREVKCPWCSHVFMWNSSESEKIEVYLYKDRETGKYAGKAKCPKCSQNMLVLDKVFEGIDIDDEKIERIGIRGI